MDGEDLIGPLSSPHCWYESNQQDRLWRGLCFTHLCLQHSSFVVRTREKALRTQLRTWKVCENVSFAPSKGGHSGNAAGYLGKPSVTDPSQLVKLPVSLLDLVCEDPALEKLYPSSYLHSGCIHLS